MTKLGTDLGSPSARERRAPPSSDRAARGAWSASVRPSDPVGLDDLDAVAAHGAALGADPAAAHRADGGAGAVTASGAQLPPRRPAPADVAPQPQAPVPPPRERALEAGRGRTPVGGPPDGPPGAHQRVNHGATPPLRAR